MNTYKVIGDDGRQYGPADLATIRAWVADGRIAPTTLILGTGTTEWKAASAFPELGLSESGIPASVRRVAPASPGITRPRPLANGRFETIRPPPGSRIASAFASLEGVLIALAVVAGALFVTKQRSADTLPTPPVIFRSSEHKPAAAPSVSARSLMEQRARHAVGQGDADAQYRLAIEFARGTGGVKRDYAEAAKWYRKAADQGHTEAQYELGRLYAQGLGVPRNYSDAAKSYLLAAEKGHVAAQHFLGHLYANGQGLETAYLEAPEGPSREQGQALARERALQNDYVEATKWWRKAAHEGDAGAQSDLGWLYTHGRGVETNYVEAAKWYRKSAEQGNSISQHWLGHIYLSGNGVDKDEVEAFKWFRQAAEKGSIAAQGDLGRMYASARGVEQNSEEAIKWYRKAAEAGIPAIQNDFAWMLATSTNASLRDGGLALQFAQKAVTTTQRRNAAFLDTLAAAHAEAGNFEKATAIQAEAIALVSDPNSRQDYTSRLKLYQTKTPYRQP